MKRFILTFAILFGLIMALICQGPSADAAKASKSKKGGMNEKQISEINTSVNNLTKKIYTRELFSPKDSEDLINAKLTLDSQMDSDANPAFAPIYYRLANVYKMRGMKPDAIDCYQTILENFSDTAYAPKARKELKDMGIEVKESTDVGDELDF